ncbi:hypothetical protein ACUUL3_08645 [Thiovibrio sp. JS02]
MELIQLLIKPIIFLIILTLVYYCCIRPMRKILSPPLPRKSQPAAKAADEEDPLLTPKRMSDRERINRLAQSDPERAKELIRKWLKENGR